MSANAALQRPAAGHVEGVQGAQPSPQGAGAAIDMLSSSRDCICIVLTAELRKEMLTRGLPPALLLQDICPCDIAPLHLHRVRCCAGSYNRLLGDQTVAASPASAGLCPLCKPSCRPLHIYSFLLPRHAA